MKDDSIIDFIFFPACIYAGYCIYRIIRYYRHENSLPNDIYSLSFKSGIGFYTSKVAFTVAQIVCFMLCYDSGVLKKEPYLYALIFTSFVSIYDSVIYFKECNTLPPNIMNLIRRLDRPSYVNCAQKVRAEITFLINSEYKRAQNELNLDDTDNTFTNLLYFTDLYLLKKFDKSSIVNVDMDYRHAYTLLNTIILDTIECGHLHSSDGCFMLSGTDLIKILKYNIKKLGKYAENFNEDKIKELDETIAKGIKAIGEIVKGRDQENKEKYRDNFDIYLKEINRIELEPIDEIINIGWYRFYG